MVEHPSVDIDIEPVPGTLCYRRFDQFDLLELLRVGDNEDSDQLFVIHRDEAPIVRQWLDRVFPPEPVG